MRRPGPVPHDTKRARTAPGSPAQWSGLGEAASYPERVGPFPSNKIDSKGAKLLSTPAHPLTAMKAKGEWVIANYRQRKENKGEEISNPKYGIFPCLCGESWETVQWHKGSKWKRTEGSRKAAPE